MLSFLNVLLFAIHLMVILFNLFGWVCKRTRRLHLWAVCITWLSWLGLGFKYGWGYCFLTDWHWDIKRKLGETNLPNSFIQYLLENLGFNFNPSTTDYITVGTFLLATGMGLYFYFSNKT